MGRSADPLGMEGVEHWGWVLRPGGAVSEQNSFHGGQELMQLVLFVEASLREGGSVVGYGGPLESGARAFQSGNFSHSAPSPSSIWNDESDLWMFIQIV